MEYDFVVAPVADPGAIRLGLVRAGLAPATGTQQAAPLRIDASGDLEIQTPGGEVRFHKPVAYQTDAGGSRRSIEGRYVFRNGQSAISNQKSEIGFELGHYDRTKPLIIDPVLSYSSYLGGTGQEIGVNIAVDSSGSAYDDAFITKFSPAGNTLVYSTYLGGSATDVGNTFGGIAVDSLGNAYVTAFTDSKDFPVTTGAFQPSCVLLPHSSVKSVKLWV